MWLCFYCPLQVLAQGQSIAALCELYVLEERHTQQDLLCLQSGRDSGPNILKLDTTHADPVQPGGVAGARSVGGLGAKRLAALQAQTPGNRRRKVSWAWASSSTR